MNAQDLKCTEMPTICLKCWEYLLSFYSFKKNYLSVQKQITYYKMKFKLRNQSFDNNVLSKIREFFANCDFDPKSSTELDSVSTQIKFEHSYMQTQSINQLNPDQKIKNRSKG